MSLHLEYEQEAYNRDGVTHYEACLTHGRSRTTCASENHVPLLHAPTTTNTERASDISL